MINASLLHLLKTPNRAYCYDAASNELLPLDESSYQFLLNLKEQQLPCNNPPSLISEYQKNGFLVEKSPVSVIQHPYSKYLGLMLERNLNHITLQVTQNCNLRCSYCVYSNNNGNYQRHHNTKRMNWETAQSAIDYLWEHSIDSNEISISFYGGEPLLEFPLIKKCVEYCNNKFEGKKISFYLTTNSTLLNEEMIRFFHQNDLGMMISLDGSKVVHDKNRLFPDGSGSFDTVMQKLEQIRELAPEYLSKISYSMVLDPVNKFDCINSLDTSCPEVNVTNLVPSFVEKQDSSNDRDALMEFFPHYTYQSFLSWLSFFGRFPKEKCSPISLKHLAGIWALIEKSESYLPLQLIDCPAGPCISGQTRLFCSVDGFFYPCERVSETSPSMIIGSIDKGINIDSALSLLNIAQLTESSCKNCWCFRFCSVCAKNADEGKEKLSSKKKLARCQQSKQLAHTILSGKVLQLEIAEFYAENVRMSG